jgi:hypothetical protein
MHNRENVKNIAPCAPISEITFVQRVFSGAMFAKKGALTMPQQCPWKNNVDSFCVYAHGRLRIRKRLFGLTQTVAR